jgi:hypothetical protein
MLHPGKETRNARYADLWPLPEIPYEQMTPEQQEAYRFLIEIRGAVGGPSKIWVHNPKLTKAAAPLGAHFHADHYSLTQRQREITVCIQQVAFGLPDKCA